MNPQSQLEDALLGCNACVGAQPRSPVPAPSLPPRQLQAGHGSWVSPWGAQQGPQHLPAAPRPLRTLHTCWLCLPPPSLQHPLCRLARCRSLPLPSPAPPCTPSPAPPPSHVKHKLLVFTFKAFPSCSRQPGEPRRCLCSARGCSETRILALGTNRHPNIGVSAPKPNSHSNTPISAPGTNSHLDTLHLSPGKQKTPPTSMSQHPKSTATPNISVSALGTTRHPNICVSKLVSHRPFPPSSSCLCLSRAVPVPGMPARARPACATPVQPPAVPKPSRPSQCAEDGAVWGPRAGR